MSERVKARSKKPLKLTPTTPLLQSGSLQRSFTAEAAPKTTESSLEDQPNLQTQLDQAKRSGFDFTRVKISADIAPTVQPKLTVGAPGDKYEQEADQMAAQVMRMPNPAEQQSIQRQTIQESPLRASLLKGFQRQEQPPIQTKSFLQRSAESSEASSDIESQLNSSKGGGSPLSNQVRSYMEPRFGADFSAVRVHTDSQSLQMNRQLGAQAFTHGSDIYFGAGKSADISELTAHELTHVVQQTGSGHLQTQLIQASFTDWWESFKSSVFGGSKKDATPTAHPTLQQGSKGSAVEELQQKLNNKGATPPLVVDGIFGPLTRTAVVEFQKSNQDIEGKPLVVDGIVGKRTWGALDQVAPPKEENKWDKFVKDITALPQAERQKALEKVRADGEWEEFLNALTEEHIALIQGWLNEDTGDATGKTLEDRIKEATNSDRAQKALTFIDTAIATKDPKQRRITPRIRELLALGVALPKLEKEDLSQEGVLSIVQVERAVEALLLMPDKEYLRLSMLMELSGDQSRLTQSFLMLEAVAARADEFSAAKGKAATPADLTDLEQFADDIRGMDQTTLVDQTSVATTSGTDGTGLTQKFTDSCGPTAAQLVRAESDPIEAMRLNKNNELGQDALNTDTAREQERALENNYGQTAVPRGRSTIITAVTTALPDSGCTAVQQKAVLDYLNGNPFSAPDFAIGITKLETSMGANFPGADALRMVRESASGTGPSAGLTPGDLVKEANTTLDVDAKTGRKWQDMFDNQLWNLYVTAGRQVTGVNMTAWSARVKALLDQAQPLVERGHDITFIVYWHGGGGHFMTFTDVRTQEGRKFLVHDPWTGTTQWVTETNILAGNWPGGQALLCGLQG